MATFIGAIIMKLLPKILLGIFVILSSTWVAASPYSQADIKQIVLEEAARQGVSPSLVLAIARVESDFNPMALSHVGAKGVMQIMPRTASTEFGVASHRLYDPYTNVRIGVSFIKQLISTYGGRVDIALSHYNGGSAVKNKYGELSIIPATAKYVKKVQAFTQHYKRAGYEKSVSKPDFASSERITLTTKQQNKIKQLDDFSWIENKPNDRLIKVVKLDDTEKLKHSDSRVDELMRLQVHNLTRHINAPKIQQTPIISMADTDFDSKKDKLEKVARWESVFNR